MRENISVSLTEELKADLDGLAQAEGVSRSDVIREAVRQYLFVHRLEVLRRELVIYAEAQGMYTDEDVFRVVS